MIITYPPTAKGEAAAFATPEPRRILFTGSQYVVASGADAPSDANAIPQSVSMRQIRLALLKAGKLDSVNTMIAAKIGLGGRSTQIEWEYAPELQRASPLIAELGAALSMDRAALDALFMAASGL